jgi:hypothetical protein
MPCYAMPIAILPIDAANATCYHGPVMLYLLLPALYLYTTAYRYPKVHSGSEPGNGPSLVGIPFAIVFRHGRGRR